MEPATCEFTGGAEGKMGMITGTVKTNYQLDYVTLTVTDSQGKEVLDHPVFVTAQKTNDYGGNYYTSRAYTDSMAMADFAAILSRTQFEQGQTYSYTVTASLATFDNVVVHEGSFQYGSIG